MKAVILAAGKGTRMGKLSEDTPKPLLLVGGKTLLAHKLDEMPKEVDEVIIVVGYLKDKIIEAIGNRYNNLKITYVILDKLLGTADALFACKNELQNENKFVVMNGDDLYSKNDITKCLESPWALLITKMNSVEGKGKVVFDEKGGIADIIEKYPNAEEGYVCSGVYSLTPEIFSYQMMQIPGGEFGLPQTILSAKKDRKINAIESTFWLQLTRPEDLQIAEEYFRIKI